MSWAFYTASGVAKTGEYLGSEFSVGTIVQSANSTPKEGWLLCDGSAVSRAAYPDLFNAIGTTYGAGNGSTTFNLPDSTGSIIYASTLTERYDSVAKLTSTGNFTTAAFSSRPSASVAGRYYLANDTGKLYFDTGTTWIEVATTTTVDTAIPIGSVQSYAGTSAPTNWLLCDGSEKAVSTYSTLDSILGTTYGSRTNGSGGAGSSHFRLPDLRGRMPLGAGTGTGLNASGSGAVSGTAQTARTAGQWGGEETHLLTTSEMPSHRHNIQSIWTDIAGNHQHNNTGAVSSGQENYALRNDTNTSAISLTGGDARHNTMPPFVVINYIIRAL